MHVFADVKKLTVLKENTNYYIIFNGNIVTLKRVIKLKRNHNNYMLEIFSLELHVGIKHTL